MKLFNEDSKELIAELRKQKRDELVSQNYPDGSGHESIYRQTTNYLIYLVLNEYLINDEEINQLVYSLYHKMAACNPTIKPVKKILIERDGLLNAASYGEGTIILNIGLIASAQSEEELAFILAHEMAHYHLEHLKQRIENHIDRNSYRPVMKRLKKIPEGNMTLEDLQFVQSWFTNFFKNSRGNELQADSLAMEMFYNCGFSKVGGLQVLEELKSVYQAPYPLNRNLFDEFIFDELPFKKRWLNTKKEQQTDNIFNHLLNSDSISTHPDVDLRLEQLRAFKNPIEVASTPLPQSLIDRSKLELINSFYKYELYDFGVHTALQLKQISDSISDIDFHISRMMYEIALAKNDEILPKYVKRNTKSYPDETRALNNFLYNLTASEAAEISYLFATKNFDPSNPNHYRILYRIHELTNRLDKNKQLKKDFKKNFPKESITKYPDDKT
ncbi:MAG: SprT-like domain-containing protein [Ekhidna sp.]